MLLRLQKAAAQGSYETGKQAVSMHLRFLTIRGFKPLKEIRRSLTKLKTGHERRNIRPLVERRTDHMRKSSEMFATKRRKGILNRRTHAQSTWHSPKENEGKATKAVRNKSAAAARKLDRKLSVVWNLLPSLAASWPLGLSF
jgi:hypothetical protein